MDLFGRKRRIAQLEESLAEAKRLSDIQQMGWSNMERRYDLLLTELRTYQRAVGRIIGKIDPAYTDDPFDPAVRARSDAIGEQVITRLRGEVVASQKQIGSDQ